MESCTRKLGISADTPSEAFGQAPLCGSEHPTRKGMFATELGIEQVGAGMLGTWWKPWTWRRIRRWDVLVTYSEPIVPRPLTPEQIAKMYADWHAMSQGLPKVPWAEVDTKEEDA